MTAHLKFKHFHLLRQQAEDHLIRCSVQPRDTKQDISELIHELNVHQIELEIQNEELSRAQVELEESRNQYIELYELAPVGYFTLNKKGFILSVNSTGLKLLETENKRLYNKKFYKFIKDSSYKVFTSHLEKVLSTKSKQICEIEIITRSEQNRYVQMQSIAGSSNLIFMTMMDITARKLAEFQLLETNKSLHLVNNLFQDASDAMAVLDKGLHFTVFNHAFKNAFHKMYGIKLSSEKSLINVLSNFPELQTKMIKACQQAFAGNKISLIRENLDNKNYYCYELHLTPFLDQSEEATRLIFLIRDITARKLRERKRFQQHAKLAHVARISAMGEMASALAHEINQPLAAISAYSQGCLLKLKDDKANKALCSTLKLMAAQAEHAGRITHRMKNFMREGAMYPEHMDINKLIKETLVFLNYEIDGMKLHTHLELAKNLPPVFIDRVQISQVILNLTRNSIEAMQNAGIQKPILTIQTKQIEENIEVNIIDNGPGIPTDIMDKILNSYFTTKPQGTGLGLAICRTLIEAHGGKLKVKPNSPGGAWFQFLLPLKLTPLDDLH